MNSFRQSLSLTARRLAAPRAAVPVVPRSFAALTKPAAPILRPFSTIGATPWQRVVAQQAFARSAPAFVEVVPVASTPSTLASVKSENLVFDIGLTYTFMHYQNIVPMVLRTAFQAFRPLLILFIFGQLVKAVFFVAGAPIWFSFYSIWMFEVGYGLFQCVLSFIFIGFFYNNLAFSRVRPTVTRMFQQQREKLAAAARTLM